MKLLISWFCLVLLLPVVAHAVSPRDSKKPQQPMARPTRPTPNVGSPSLSSAGRPQPSVGNMNRPNFGNDANRKPSVSMLPSAGTRPSVNRPGSNDRPGTNRPATGFDRPGFDKPGYNRPIDQRPDVVVNRPDINFNRPTVNRPSFNNNDINVNRPIYNRPVNSNNTTIVNRPVTNNTIVNNTVVNKNTNIINKNYGNQNTFNRPGYNGNYGDNYYRPSRDYYPHLHNHWQPTTWSGGYQPAYYNYSYSSGGLTLSTTNFAFSNPYYVQPAVATTAIYDYSQPIRVPVPNYQESNDELIRSERAIRRFDDAREVFRRGEYGRANELIDEAIELLPSDPNLHEFRSLVLFARKRYSEAAAALYSVLAVSPGWDAGTIAGLYDDPQVYLQQAVDLEEFAKANREAMDARFLLVYHDLVRGDQVRAEKLLASCVAKQPDDRVMQTLLTALQGKIAESGKDPLLP
jgi:tetratricopeptide (TPR) repeat protein